MKPCRRCGALGRWRIQEVRERAANQFVPLTPIHRHVGEKGEAIWNSIGRFEITICGRCGRVDWFVRDAPEALAEIDLRPRCGGCESDRGVYLHQLLERKGDALVPLKPAQALWPVPTREGELSGIACAQCGLMHWRTDGPETGALYDNVDEDPKIVDGVCLECGECHAIASVEPVKEAVEGSFPEPDWHPIREDDLPVAVYGAGPADIGTAIGHFALHVCQRCRSVEWYARKIESLAPDGAAGVEWEDGHESQNRGGPYR